MWTTSSAGSTGRSSTATGTGRWYSLQRKTQRRGKGTKRQLRSQRGRIDHGWTETLERTVTAMTDASIMSRQQGVILVTGSSGLIGSSVVNRLAEKFRVIGFDREGPPHPPPTAECVCVD